MIWIDKELTIFKSCGVGGIRWGKGAPSRVTPLYSGFGDARLSPHEACVGIFKKMERNIRLWEKLDVGNVDILFPNSEINDFFVTVSKGGKNFNGRGKLHQALLDAERKASEINVPSNLKSMRDEVLPYAQVEVFINQAGYRIEFRFRTNEGSHFLSRTLYELKGEYYKELVMSVKSEADKIVRRIYGLECDT